MPDHALPDQSKNIVLLSDGTGNRGGKGHGTNVWRTYLAVERLPGRGHEQLAFYDDGVGTEDFKLLRALGAAVGWGLGRNIRQLYAALARNYAPGDDIYMLGFSRGGYTVRLLAGMICRFGVIDAAGLSPDRLDALVERTYRLYHRGDATEIAAFQREHCHAEETRVRFVGVWDTVDAVGVPFDWMRDWIDRVFKYRFADHRLSPRVDKGCHAMAIDDARTTFHAELWDEHDERCVEGEEPRIEQLWFAGVHGNVGGGYPKDQLALNSLGWMWAKASACGLRLQQADCEEYGRRADATGKLYDSRAGLAAFYRYGPRQIDELCTAAGLREVRLHDSVLRRLRRAGDGYLPANLCGRVVSESGECIDLPDLSAEVSAVQRRLRIGYGLSWLATLSALWLLGAPLLLDIWRGEFAALWHDLAAEPMRSALLIGGHGVAFGLLIALRQRAKVELRRIGARLWQPLLTRGDTAQAPGTRVTSPAETVDAV